MCEFCGWSAVPRFISPEESVQFGREAAASTSKREFDDAEFWLRRIIGSWPGYPAGYADLGQLSFARSEAADTLAARRRYRSDAEVWLRRAVDADPDQRFPGVRVPFARILALNGDERKALDVLERLFAEPALPEPVRSDAERLVTDLRDGKLLFYLAGELAGTLAFDQPPKRLSAEDRRSLQQARVLLRQAGEKKDAFATSMFLGKVEMRLGDMAAARATLEHAHGIDPHHADGCRELASVYLELDRPHDALPAGRRAVELRPEDMTLRSNLALILLLVGAIADARAEAAFALSRDPSDAITRNLIRLIDDVLAGRRERPRTIAEAEGRNPPARS
jgi:Flp pilus assembly protein TadD